MLVRIYYYFTLEQSYGRIEINEKTKLREITEEWKYYFRNSNLRVWKFKINGKITDGYSENIQECLFDEDMTLEEYVKFYKERKMIEEPFIIFI